MKRRAADSPLAGRYALLGDAAAAGMVGRDLAADRDVRIARWHVPAGDWAAEGNRLRQLAELHHPTLEPLLDFGFIEASETVFAVAAAVAEAQPLAKALVQPSVPLATWVRDAVHLASFLHDAGVPGRGFDARDLRVVNGSLRLEAIDLARPHARTSGLAGLATLIRAKGKPSRPLGRLLEGWRSRTPPAPAETLLALATMDPTLSQSTPIPAAPRGDQGAPLRVLGQALHDLVEAGRGGVIGLLGRGEPATSRLLHRFGLDARVLRVPFHAAAGPSSERSGGALATLVRQLSGAAPEPFLWRHGAELSAIALGTPALGAANLVCKLIQTVALERPVVLAIPDLQRVGPEELERIRSLALPLAAAPGGHGALLVLAVELAPDPASAAARLLEELAASAAYRELRLLPDGIPVAPAKQPAPRRRPGASANSQRARAQPESAPETRAAAAWPTPGLTTGNVESDLENLALVSEALAAHPGEPPEAALLRLVRCLAGSAGIVTRAAPDGEPPEVVVAVGDPIPDALLAQLSAAPGATIRESAVAAHTTAVTVPLVLEPSGSVLGTAVVLRDNRARPPRPVPATVVRALARPLALAVREPSRRGAPETAASSSVADGFRGLVGQTPAMRRLFRLLERVVTSDLPVLLHGESGTGKGLVARAIHDASARRAAPFVPIDCAAIPESLMESELFGHRRGSFTGAASDRSGLFEQAEGGTVFLDEITNIPGGVQAKLLRVLQEREVRRVGDSTVRPIHVRVIAATNQPLEVLVAAGEFREDLYFRLNVIEVLLPPLRERLDDVPLLVEHFLSRAPGPRHEIQRAALDRLCAYDWPGNVRELDNEIRRAVAIAGSRPIREGDLSPRLARGAAPRPRGDLPTLRAAVAALERDLVTRALKSCNRNRAQAARLLGLSHQGLLNKIRKYSIQESPPEKNPQDS